MNLISGTKLGRYEIRSKLGEGGMGEVYLAQDTKLDRTVALKVLPADLAGDQSRMRRFVQEARTASALSHPNVAHIYEIEDLDDVHFIAMEFIDGETLRHRISTSELPLPEVLEVAMQVAAALSAAHAAGVTHRDIKSDNVMLRPDGYVKVLDFGLAKLTDRPAEADKEAPTRALVNTDPGTVMGTLGFMSPEQARGQATDARTDIWSLGVVIYQMVTHHLPFQGSSNSDVIASILGKEPPPMARYAREVPEALEWIVTKALTKDPDERYQTAKEMMVDLRRIKQKLDAQSEIERSSLPGPISSPVSSSESATMIAGRGVSRTPSTQTGRTSTAPAVSSAEYVFTEIKRHRLLVAAMLVVVVGALAGVGFLIFKYATANRLAPAPAALKFTRLTNGGKVGNEIIQGGVVISADGKYVVLGTSDTEGRMSFYVRQVATNSLVKIAGPMESFNGSGTTFSPDGDYVYFPNIDKANPDGALYRVPVFGGTPQKILAGIWSSITFSPDGKQIAYVRLFPATGESWLVIASADGSGAPQTIARKKLPDYYATDGPSWSPDGTKIVVGINSIPEVNSATLVAVTVKDGSESVITKPQWSEMRRILWLKDGSGLVFTANSSFLSFGTQIWQVSYPGGAVRRITNDLNGYGTISLGLTADDQTIATVQDDATRNIFIATPGQDSSIRQITNGKREGSLALAATPDGRIVFMDDTGGGYEIWTMKSDGSERKQLTSDGAIKFTASVTPDGRYILFNSNRSGSIDIWRMDLDGNNQKQLTRNEAFAYSPVGSNDGNSVVYTGLRAGKWVLLKVPIDGGDPSQVSDRQCGSPGISPDGKLIVCLTPDERASFNWQAAIISFAGGETTKLLDLPPGFSYNSGFQWTPDGKSILYVAATSGAGNIYSQAIDGGAPKPLTNFKSDYIDAFTCTRDRKQLIFGRGGNIEDVVLIKDFR